ncbi:flippase [Candidatus Poribacteria bacterium]
MRSSSIIKNTSFLLMANLARSILSAVLYVILPRYLEGSFDDLGKLFTVLWLTNLLGVVTGLGLHTPLIREMAADRSKASQMISNAIVVRVALSLITFLVIMVLAKFVYPDLTLPLYIVGLAEIINAFARMLRCVFRSFERMEFEALGTILERLAVVPLGLYVVSQGHGIMGFCIVVLVASILHLALTFFIVLWGFDRPSFGLVDVKLAIHLLKQALPFALGGALSAIYFRIDGLMLKHMMGVEGDVTMGWYGTGYGLIMTLTVISGAFMGAVFPVMSRMLHSSESAMDFLYTKSLKLMFIIALPIAVGMTFLADGIVTLLYPIGSFTLEDQAAISRILEILSWSCALTFLNVVFITIFRAADKRRAFLTIIIASVTVNIASNLILIPKYAHIGASISMVISELVIFIYGIWYIGKYVCKLNEFSFWFRATFASGLLAIGLFIWKYTAWLGESLPLSLVICLSVIGYFAVILALKGVTGEDISMLKSQFRTPQAPGEEIV